MKANVVEFIGTFFLVFTIGMTVLNELPLALAPLAIASILAAVIYAGGPISGAHYNPAVTVGAIVRGSFPASGAAGYLIAQIAAALLAAGLVTFLKQPAPVVAPVNGAFGPVFAAEFVFTFALVFVILCVATRKATTGNSYFGAAIALVVLAGACAVGPVSGGAFNPAVALAGCVLGLLPWSNIWIYLLAEFAGAVAAAAVFKFCNDD